MISQTITVWLDVSKQKFVDENGYTIPQIYIYANSQVVFRVYVVEDFINETPVDLSSAELYYGFDSTYTTLHADLITQSEFNDYDDWNLADPTNGLICWRINTGNSAITNFLGSSQSKTVYSDLWIIRSDGEEGVDILLNADIYTLKNIVSEPDLSGEESSSSSSSSSVDD